MARNTVDLSNKSVAELDSLYDTLTSNYAEARDCGGNNVRSLSASIRWVVAELKKRGVGGYFSASKLYELRAEYESEICGA